VNFYFPETGEFLHFPTNAAVERTVVAKAEQNLLRVAKVQAKIDSDSFDDILATGSIPAMLKFMENKNIANEEESGFKMR